jgi:hypothetical protein
MEWEPICDAIVSFPDALRWVEPLIKAKPDDVIDQALAVEPAVLGVAADLARRTCERLEKRGVPEEICEYVYDQITLAGAMSIELMRKGNAKLWDDFIEPPNEEQEGIDHE